MFIIFKKIFASFVVLFLLLTTSYLLPATILAADLPNTKDSFASSYDIAYDVAENGVTTVTEKITLRNLTSQYYATQFNLTIGTTKISDVKAFDASGQMDTTVAQKGTATDIIVKFNQQVVGLGKELPWTLQYRSQDFAQKQGKIWEVTIPRVSSGSQIDGYKVTLSVPLDFGEPTLITPNPKSQTTDFGKMFLTFDKEQLQNSGISATFGSSQLYDFDLTYHLENTNLVPILTNIALPPDTNFQDVIYQRIDPKPINVTVDKDGNYLAWYRLDRNQKITVNVVGSVKLFTKSRVRNAILSAEEKILYTASGKYWELDNPVIKNKLAEILKDNPNASDNEKVSLIYKYVVNYLKYDPTRLNNNNIQRFGAVTALSNPTEAVCMEFTDLFIALTRAAGIPARELDGFAYTNNSTLRPSSLNRDVLHAWPEYWDDKKGWVMVDPTWENTTQGVDYFNKLDLNHFAFVVKGESSEQPVPAGSYKFQNHEDSRDVVVNLSDVDFLGKPQMSVDINIQDQISAGFPGKFSVVVSNQGNATFYPANFSVNGSKLTILNNNQTLGVIPPFGFEEFVYNFRTKSFFDSFTNIIKVTINNQNYEKTVQVIPFFLFRYYPFILAGIVFAMMSIYFVIITVIFYRSKLKKRKDKDEVIEDKIIEEPKSSNPVKSAKTNKTTPKRTFFKRK